MEIIRKTNNLSSYAKNIEDYNDYSRPVIA